MYNLLNRIPNGLEPLREQFEQHVKRAGEAAVEKIMPTPASAAEGGKTEAIVSSDTLSRSGIHTDRSGPQGVHRRPAGDSYKVQRCC